MKQFFDFTFQSFFRTVVGTHQQISMLFGHGRQSKGGENKIRRKIDNCFTALGDP
jgi:hypothetical protein